MTSAPPAAPLGRVFAFLFARWRRQGAVAAAIVFAMAISTAAEIATPLFAGRLVDAVTAGLTPAARHAAITALLWLAAFGAFTIIVQQAAFIGIVRFTLHMMRDAKAEGFALVQLLSAAWHADSFAGSTVRQILRGAGAMDSLNDQVFFNVVPTLVVTTGATILLGIHWPIMGAAILTGSLIYATLTFTLSITLVAPAAQLSNAWDTRVSGALSDALTCNAVVRAFAAEAREQHQFDRILAKWARRTRRTWTRGIFSYSAQTAALLLLQLLIAGTILYLWTAGRAGAGDVTTVLATYFVLHGYLHTMSQSIREIYRGIADMQELVALHGQIPTIVDRPGAPALRLTAGTIAVQNLRFRYGAHATPLFDNLSVTLRAGERVGLVGPSGSGKSTFVRLIQRLADLDGGRILIDGQDIAAVTQQSLRAQIAIVPQEPILFHRTLAENIAYARPAATRAEIEHAAHLANAHGFITRLPRGYATLVGERGIKLSGGERQRVAIARAFLAACPILILDEATSSLDSDSEATIAEAAARLMTGRTCLVIAHRLSTVRAMDRILAFDHGRIVEEGTHDALVARPHGLYRGLFERQALGLVHA